MKVLTIRQPWATAIILGAKDIENRTWTPGGRLPLGERFAVHAGAAIDTEAPAYLLDAEHLRDRGVVLGTVRLVSAHAAGSPVCACAGNPWAFWTDGVHHWILADPRPLTTPIRARGQLGLWESPTIDHLLTLPNA